MCLPTKFVYLIDAIFFLFYSQFFIHILNQIQEQNVSYHTFQGYCGYVERYCQRNRRHL